MSPLKATVAPLSDRKTSAGGTDTTATAAQGVIFSILNDPAIYSRLRAELDSFCRLHRNTLKFPVQDAMARRMPYLQACIYEGLRKYPPLFQLRERVVPATGGHLHGFYLPAGTFVGINGLATQLDDVYGDDPQTFSPERWLIEDGVRLRQMHRVLELVFGYGSSKCLGLKMAYTELNKIVFEVRRWVACWLQAYGSETLTGAIAVHTLRCIISGCGKPLEADGKGHIHTV